MNCAKHPVENEKLMAYLDGELPLDHAAGVATHLSQCGECQGLADEFRLLSQQLLAWQVEPSPDRLTQRITAAVAARDLKPESRAHALVQRISARVKQKRVPPWAWGMAAASFAGLLLVVHSPYKTPRVTNPAKTLTQTVDIQAYNPPAA